MLEKNESLRKVADDSGVSQETRRRGVRAARGGYKAYLRTDVPSGQHRLGIEVTRRVSGCGKRFHQPTAKDTAETSFWAAYAAVIAFRATLRSGKSDGGNRPCRALEEHPAKAARPFCAHDVVVFQVRGDARGESPALSSSLQSRPGHPSRVTHYPKPTQRQNSHQTESFKHATN